MYYLSVLKRILPILGFLFITTHVESSFAVPSFARQTNLQCSSCHSAYPQLNAFGRRFKMQGYTFASSDINKANNGGFNSLATAPISLMFLTSWSRLKDSPDPATDNSQIKFPAELSLFYAGRITDKIGAFAQITAEEGDSFSQDNTDIRYASQTQLGGRSVFYGVTLNNNPTVQDPWSSTPVWSFPWFEAGYGYAYPETLIGSLGGSVAGLTAYGFWDNHIYAELGSYQASNTGGDLSANAIDNNAPYWRFAYAADGGGLDWMFGTFGLGADIYDPLGQTQDITDIGLDAEIQRTLDNGQSLTLDASYIHEEQPHGEHLGSTMVNVTWYLNSSWGVTTGYRGALSSQHALAPDDDYRWSDAGDLDADAYHLQLHYMPRQNTRFALQYTAYSKLNGTTKQASSNNQVMLGAWLTF